MIAPCPSLTSLIARLRASVRVAAPQPDAICRDAAASLAPCLRDPSWLPAELAIPAPSTYRRELLHEEDDGAFSVGCFVWGAGQATPIHDHRCWGVAGVLVGALREESFQRNEAGALEKTGRDATLHAGDIGFIDPALDHKPRLGAGRLGASGASDIHRVGAATDTVSISLHVYGGRLAEVCRTRYADPVAAPPPGWREGDDHRVAAFPERWRPYF